MGNAATSLRVLSLAAIVTFGLALRAEPLLAQDPPTPQPVLPWIQFTIVDVDPTMTDEFIAVQREITARIRRPGGGAGGGRGGPGGGGPPAAVAPPPQGPPGMGGPGGPPQPPPWRIVSRTETFGDANRFVIAMPSANLAAFDRRIADPELSALQTRSLKYIRSQHTFAVRTFADLENPLPAKQAPGLIVVSLVKVAPGKEQDYYNVMKSDFIPHFNKAEWFHSTGSLAFGGESGFLHLYHVGNFAKLDEGSPVMKALGPAGAQAAAAKLAGVVVSEDRWIVRTLADLSYGPWSPAPQQGQRP